MGKNNRRRGFSRTNPNDEINGFRVEFKEDNIKIGFTKNSEFTLFIHIQEDDIIVKNGSENGVEYNRNTGKPYMLLRPYSYEIEAKEYPGQIFERTNYTNGNKYWGETYNGQRHGYGIHIWEMGICGSALGRMVKEMDTALTLILRHTPFSQENGLEMN